MPKTTLKKPQKNTPKTPEPAPQPTDPPKVEAEAENPEPPPITEAPPPDNPESGPATAAEAPTRRKAGRPRAEEDRSGEPQIMDRIRAIANWEGTKVYVYRHGPIIDLHRTGSLRTNVCVYKGPFDQEDMLKDPGLGSGLYGLIVNRKNPQTRKDEVIDSGEVELLNMAFPPRVPRGTWVDDERNDKWKWAKDIWDREDADKLKALAPAAPDNGHAVFTPLLDMMKEQLRTTQDEVRSLREALTRKDPQEQSVLTVLLQKVLQPPPTPAPDPVRDMLMTYLLRQLETKSEATAPKDPRAEAEASIEFYSKMREVFQDNGKPSRSKMSGWQEMLQPALPIIGQALGPLIQVMAQQMTQRPATPTDPGQATAATALPAPPSAPTESPTAAPGPKLINKQPTIEGFAAAVLTHLKAGQDGYALGDWYLGQFGSEEFTDIRLQGKLRLVEDLKSIPNTWKHIAAFMETGALDTMLTQFLTWEPPEGDEDDEEEPPPVGVANQPINWTTPTTPTTPETRA